MMFWVIKYTPLFDERKNKILDLPAGSIVEKTSWIKDDLSEIKFITRAKTYTGWVYTSYLEELIYQHKQNTVFTQPTDYPYDAAQYIVWEGSTLYNLCGEACVAYIFKDSVENLLQIWKAKPASLYNRIINNGKSATTVVSDLINMVSIYNGKTNNLNGLLFDDISRSALITPARLSKVLEDYNLIVSCKIGTNGELKASGILHWIVLEKVVQDGVNRGWVEVWNPYSGRTEFYSWREFSASTLPLYGLSIERKP